MFEKLAEAASKEIGKLSNGQLYCLPYSITLQDFFESRGIDAKLLVVRGVVFSSRDAFAWRDFPTPRLAAQVITGELANGGFDIEIAGKNRRVFFRTIGYPHGKAELGSYSDKGTWRGHLINVVGNTAIDLTIAQLNDPACHINFSPSWITYNIGPEFLTGKMAVAREIGGKMVVMQGYPDEKTYQQSNSWSGQEERQSLKNVAARLMETFKNQPDEAFHSNKPAKSVTGPKAQTQPKLASQPGAVSRNRPCPCGSGKKYKKCCGQSPSEPNETRESSPHFNPRD